MPVGVPTRAFGPTVDAVVAVFMGVYRLTKRQVPELMRDLFGLHMSVGAILGCQESASAAIAEAVEDARSYVKEQPVKHADETGWREGAGRSRAWLWTVVTTHVVVFMIHARRNAEAAKELLGKWCGVLVTDRHGAYNWWPNCRRQFCWAHLKRDLQASHPKTSKTCTMLLKRRDALWTFVYLEGVEPTNNGAEQVVRHGVIMRKISYGTRSVAGSRFVERMLTVHATLRRQRRNILDFMRAACTAALRSHPAPSILPIEASVIPPGRVA